MCHPPLWPVWVKGFRVRARILTLCCPWGKPDITSKNSVVVDGQRNIRKVRHRLWRTPPNVPISKAILFPYDSTSSRKYLFAIPCFRVGDRNYPQPSEDPISSFLLKQPWMSNSWLDRKAYLPLCFSFANSARSCSLKFWSTSSSSQLSSQSFSSSWSSSAASHATFRT